MSTGLKAVYSARGIDIDLARRELLRDGIPIPIGARAFDIVEALVTAAGELVTKDSLAQRIWPNAVVGENTLQVHVSAIRRALGPDRDLLQTVSGRGYRLLGTWTTRTREGLPVSREGLGTTAGEQADRAGLPSDAASIIGRDLVIAQIQALSSAYRIVTLVGPGGIGKTRLAIAAARALTSEFGDEIFFVELAAITDPGLVEATLANAAGLVLDHEPGTTGRVVKAIGARKLCLVLDNCEHVVERVAALVESLVRRCHNVSILASSREALNVEGEFVLSVQPLSVPGKSYGSSDQLPLEEHSAVQLFIARLGEARAGLAPTAPEIASIAVLCRRLDGLPLAIEFAAARAAVLGIETVLASLDDIFSCLGFGRRAKHSHQRTLQATLDWSYQLLTEDEQRSLCWFAVFPGGVTLDAAAQVVTDGSQPQVAIFDAIAGLVAKSLILLDREARPARWRLLEITRSYARAKLALRGELESANRRQAVYFATLFPLEHRRDGAEDFSFRERMARGALELDNVRAALDWAFGPSGDAGLGIRLTAGFSAVWLHLQFTAECNARIELALQHLGTDRTLTPAERMRLLSAFSTGLLLSLGQLTRAEAVIGEALDIAIQIGDREQQFDALWNRWSLNATLGEQSIALELLNRAKPLAEELGAVYSLLVDRAIGTTEQFMGQTAEARPRLERFLRDFTSDLSRPQTPLFHDNHRIVAGTGLARALWLQGKVGEARDQIAATIAEAKQIGGEAEIRYPLAWGLIPISGLTGDFTNAQSALDRLMALRSGTKLTFWNASGRAIEGSLMVLCGHAAAGVAILKPALETCVRTGWMTCYGQFLGTYAAGMTALGWFDEARAAIEDALTWSTRTGETWFVPELWRLRGELVLHEQGSAALETAIECFCRAAAISRQQKSLFWELRSVLAHGRHLGDSQIEARQLLLGPVCSRFATGENTADLREARALIA